LEDLDALAGNIAFNHVQGVGELNIIIICDYYIEFISHHFYPVITTNKQTILDVMIVTAGVDRIRIRERPKIGVDQYLSGKVTWVGSSSMEIRMVISESEDGSNEWLESYFTFVTLDPVTKKSIKICPLLPQTEEERVHFELGAVKAQAKKVARRNKIQVGRPLSEESLAVDRRAAELLDAAGPLLRMPTLADPNTILMDATAHSNAMVAQPQSRNLHDRIFGGFLMRRAFELAFSTAYSEYCECESCQYANSIQISHICK
jgi:acyl-coenzyme A thioesterase 9